MLDKRIGLLVLSIGNFGNKEFYNLQEVGLAKALSKFFKEILIYKLVERSEQETTEIIDGYSNTALYLLPSKKIGSNGIPDVKKMDSSVDILICFSDTQIMVPFVEKWCRKNSIKFIPYVGVSKSHSNKLIKRLLIDILFFRNLAIYRKNICLAKTLSVSDSLRTMGVRNVLTAPIGLDIDRLKRDYRIKDVSALKMKYGYLDTEKIILFIGRMTPEKQPERMLRIFKQIHTSDQRFRLLMIGNGELSGKICELIKENNLEAVVNRLDRIPNKDIWELYRIAEVFVNLNQQEIFGMAILEAMYYGCNVVAWHAPGPDFIIEDGKSGYLAGNEEDIIKCILEKNRLNGHKRVMDSFTWKNTAKLIYECVKAEGTGA